MSHIDHSTALQLHLAPQQLLWRRGVTTSALVLLLTLFLTLGIFTLEGIKKIIIITGIGRPTSATPRDHGDSTSGNKDAEENDGDQLDDVTDDVRGVDVTSR